MFFIVMNIAQISQITYKLYIIVIVCLLASCFMCRNVSLGLLCTENNTEVGLQLMIIFIVD